MLLCRLLVISTVVYAQQCGPLGPSGPAAVLKCPPTRCCSQYGWCGTSLDYCDQATCQPAFSGDDSACASLASSSTSPSTSSTKSPASASPFQSSIPEIDTCGEDSKVSCPGAGKDGYFYRCCSSYGHCGPKNELQDQKLYCGTGCQKAWGNCETNRAVPPDPTASPSSANSGEPCGPIVHRYCANALCCSGSNYCGQPLLFREAWKRESNKQQVPASRIVGQQTGVKLDMEDVIEVSS